MGGGRIGGSESGLRWFAIDEPIVCWATEMSTSVWESTVGENSGHCFGGTLVTIHRTFIYAWVGASGVFFTQKIIYRDYLFFQASK